MGRRQDGNEMIRGERGTKTILPELVLYKEVVHTMSNRSF